MPVCTQCKRTKFIVSSRSLPSGISKDIVIKCPFTPDGDICNGCAYTNEVNHTCGSTEHQIQTYGADKLVITNFTYIPKNEDIKLSERCSFFFLNEDVKLYRRKGRLLCMVLSEFPDTLKTRDQEINTTLVRMGVGCKVLKTILIKGDNTWAPIIEKLQQKVDETDGYYAKDLFRLILRSAQATLSFQEYGGISLRTFCNSPTMLHLRSIFIYGQFLNCIRNFLISFSSGWKLQNRIHGGVDDNSLKILIESENYVKKISVINNGYISKIVDDWEETKLYNDFEILLFKLNRRALRSSESYYYSFCQLFPLEVNLFVSFSIDSSVNKSDTRDIFMKYVIDQQTAGYMVYLDINTAIAVFDLCLRCFGTNDKRVYKDDKYNTRVLLLRRARHYYIAISANIRRHGVNMNCFVDTYAISYWFCMYLGFFTEQYKSDYGDKHYTYHQLSRYKQQFAFALSQPMTIPLDKGTSYNLFCDWDCIISDLYKHRSFEHLQPDNAKIKINQLLTEHHLLGCTKTGIIRQLLHEENYFVEDRRVINVFSEYDLGKYVHVVCWCLGIRTYEDFNNKFKDLKFEFVDNENLNLMPDVCKNKLKELIAEFKTIQDYNFVRIPTVEDERVIYMFSLYGVREYVHVVCFFLIIRQYDDFDSITPDHANSTLTEMFSDEVNLQLKQLFAEFKFMNHTSKHIQSWEATDIPVVTDSKLINVFTQHGLREYLNVVCYCLCSNRFMSEPVYNNLVKLDIKNLASMELYFSQEVNIKLIELVAQVQAKS